MRRDGVSNEVVRGSYPRTSSSLDRSRDSGSAHMKQSFPSATILGLILVLNLHAAEPGAPTTERLPEEISPAPAIIPERRFVITDFGAVGDGKTTNTDE